MMYAYHEHTYLLRTTLSIYQTYICRVITVYAYVFCHFFCMGIPHNRYVWHCSAKFCKTLYTICQRVTLSSTMVYGISCHVMRCLDVLSPFFQCQYSLSSFYSVLRVRPTIHSFPHDGAVTTSHYFSLFFRHFSIVHPKHDGSFLTSGGALCA